MKTFLLLFSLLSLLACIKFVESHDNHTHDEDDSDNDVNVNVASTRLSPTSTASESNTSDHHHSHVHDEDNHDHAKHHHHHSSDNLTAAGFSGTDSIRKTSVFHLWLYGTGAVLFISVAGLLAITTVPRIATHHHGDILQLLVGLAIGTLTSDALLHLLPHAFSGSSHDHSHNENVPHLDVDGEDDQHTHNVWNGLMALMGIIGFLAFERILTIVSDLSSKSHGKTTKVASCDRDAIDKADHGHNHKESLLLPPEKEKLNPSHCESGEKDQVTKEPMDQVSCMKVGPDTPLTTEQCHRETMVYQHPDPDRGYVIQLMDHHHHHQHGSTSQKGAKSVIYMIVTGDGLHNFFDGLAIGIAFAGGVSGGISTSIAVLCHELPHEVGDFAVLLKAGLAAKKAVMYNTISAFLCFIGMTVGVLAANMDTAMLSSIIAGMFIYIALVDMIPQLDCCPNATGTTRAFKLTVQLCGMGIGVLIMSIISIYEPALKRIVS